MEWMDRFVKIMNIISKENKNGMGITMLASETGLSKGTLHRILQDMVSYKIIIQNPETKKYYLGPLSMIWGSRFVKGKDVSELLASYCDEVADKTQLYTFICRFVTNEVYCIYAYEPIKERRTTYFVHVGQRMPLHASAAAKVVLAYQPQEKVRYLLEQSPRQTFTKYTCSQVSDLMEELAKVRSDGVAWCHEEMEIGVSAISVPLFTANNVVCFSLSLVGNSDDIKTRQDRLCEQILSARNTISTLLSAINDFAPFN